MNWQLGLGRENGLAFWGLLFIEGSFGAFFPIWPLYMEELGAPIAVVGMLLALGGVFRFFVLLPTARLARMIGSRRLLLISRVLSSLAIGGAAFAPGWEWLIPVLLGSALGSMAFPILLAHISANAREGESVRAFSIIVTIGPSIAMLVAPLISSGLIAMFDLRASLLFAAALSLLSAVVLSGMSESGALEEQPGEDPKTRGGSYASALRNVPVRNLLLLKLFTVFALGIGSQLVPNYLREVGGYPDSQISLLSAFSALGTIAFGALVVRNKRFSATPLLGVALAVFVVSSAYVLYLFPSAVALVVVAYLFRGGFFASISLFSAVLGEFTAARDREYVFTLSEIAIVIGMSVAPLVAGLLYDVEPSLPLIVSACAGVPVILLLLRMSRWRRQELAPAVVAPVGGAAATDRVEMGPAFVPERQASEERTP